MDLWICGFCEWVNGFVDFVEFVEHQHEVSKCVKKKKKTTIQVSGRLGVANPHKIVLTQFNYDGLGPAAFFLAGSSTSR